MAKTYYLGSTTSDLTGGADFNKYLEEATETSGSLSPSINGSTTEVSRTFTRSGVPGTDGATGNYTIEVNVTTANTNIRLALEVHRVNSSGTVQSSSGASAEQQLSTTGVKTYTFTALDLGTWAAGDRLRVDYRFRNTNLSSQSVTIQTGTTNTEHITPFSSAQTIAVGQATSSHTAFSITPQELHGFGQVTETDVAQAIKAQRRKAIGQSSETDTAQTIIEFDGLGKAIETDTAQSVRPQRSKGFGLVTESDIAQALQAQRRKAFGQSSETDTAYPFGDIVKLGRSSETDTAHTIRAQRAKALGLVSESDLAQLFTTSKRLGLGLVSETDAALALLSRLLDRNYENRIDTTLIVREEEPILVADL